jgi:thiol-disulfide isomerase/thioredoxin
VLWRIRARTNLMETYVFLGRSPDVVRLGTAAIHLLPLVPYLYRSPGNEIGLRYLEVAQALSGQPDARAKIEALNAVLRSTYAPPPAEYVALDSGFIGESRYRQSEVEEMIRNVALLGTQGVPLVSNYWVNRPTTDSAVIPVNDGKIRLIENFSYGCDGCLSALHSLQRIQNRFPESVQAMATAFTLGYWANRLVPPDEEAQRLNDYFTKQLKVTFPVAIWKWKKVRKEDGGERLEQLNDNVWATPIGLKYPILGKPTTFILDGQGRIRRIFIGGGREIEPLMIDAVEFLQREAAQQKREQTQPAQPRVVQGTMSTEIRVTEQRVP